MRSRTVPLLRRATPWLLSALLAAGPALADEPPKPLAATLTGMAKAEYEGGKILFQDGDYASALVKFQHALELSRDPRLHWNIAACEKSLRHYTRVLSELDLYLKEGDKLLTEEDRRDAAEIQRTVKTLVSSLRVLVSEDGADVFVDDRKIGASPLGAVLVDVGERRIRVKKEGFKEHTETLKAPGASELTVAVRLAREVHEGRLAVEAGARDLIAIDGKAVGLGRWDGALSSGGHTLRVTAPGMAAYQSEVVVQDGAARSIRVALNPLPKAGGSYAWLWAAGGAVLVTGAAIGGALLFKPARTPETTGTFDTVYLGKSGGK